MPRTKPKDERPQSRRRCHRCGCDEEHACVDRELTPCHWISRTLCSHCADRVPSWKPGMIVYQGLWFHESISVVARWLVIERPHRSPVIVNELSRNVVRRPELLRAPNQSLVDEIATSILADLLGDDNQAADLGPLYSPVLNEQFGENWLVNEFELREWVAENTIPY